MAQLISSIVGGITSGVIIGTLGDWHNDVIMPSLGLALIGGLVRSGGVFGFLLGGVVGGLLGWGVKHIFNTRDNAIFGFAILFAFSGLVTGVYFEQKHIGWWM